MLKHSRQGDYIGWIVNPLSHGSRVEMVRCWRTGDAPKNLWYNHDGRKPNMVVFIPGLQQTKGPLQIWVYRSQQEAREAGIVELDEEIAALIRAKGRVLDIMVEENW